VEPQDVKAREVAQALLVREVDLEASEHLDLLVLEALLAVEETPVQLDLSGQTEPEATMAPQVALGSLVALDKPVPLVVGVLRAPLGWLEPQASLVLRAGEVRMAPRLSASRHNLLSKSQAFTIRRRMRGKHSDASKQKRCSLSAL